jgi:riboflavin biosynthesis pyrimidine reductase/pyrimidine deaminase RibD-like protein
VIETRPYVLLSCATSADGYLDDASPHRLILSGPADLDRVDELRASCDAIMVGAGTVRKDNPRLLIRDPRRAARRAARGRPEHPLRVTLTASGNLDLCSHEVARPFVVYQGADLSLPAILENLKSERSVARLLLEGGAHLIGQFLAQDLVNELHLAVAPFFIADPGAPRLNLPAVPGSGRMTLIETRRLEDIVLLRYLLGPGGTDYRFLRLAIELSRECPPSASAFSVGAVIVAEDGEVLSTGFSREQEDKDHAEEVALRKLGVDIPGSAPGPSQSGAAPSRPDPRLSRATLYSSLVPCGARASRPVTCAQHIINAGIPRVVYAWDEPPLFTDADGAEHLRAAGVGVTHLPALSGTAREVNAHLDLAGRSMLGGRKGVRFDSFSSAWHGCSG